MWIPTHIQICNMARAMGSLLSLTVICGCATPLAGLDESREPWTEDLVYDPIADDSQPVFDEDDSIETQRLAARATREDVRGIVLAPKPFRWVNPLPKGDWPDGLKHSTFRSPSPSGLSGTAAATRTTPPSRLRPRFSGARTS